MTKTGDNDFEKCVLICPYCKGNTGHVGLKSLSMHIRKKFECAAENTEFNPDTTFNNQTKALRQKK
jgi:hypothetical protein